MTPFVVTLRPSRLWLCLVLILSASVLTVAVTQVPGGWWLPLPWLVWRALSADGWLTARRRAERIEVSGSGRLSLVEKGRSRAATLYDHSVALPGLIVLNACVAGRRRSIAIFSDSAPPDEQRRLRVWLRWSGNEQPLAE